MLTTSRKAKQLIILSGKGGTGKTSLSAAFAQLSGGNEPSHAAVFVDADVDASNLSLVLRPISSDPHEFWGGSIADIDANACAGCEACVSVCRYDAILADSKHRLVCWIDPIACDGCAACVYACPQGAIRMVPQQEGQWFQSSISYGSLLHAELFPGKDNSGKLVTLIKQKARLLADDAHSPLVIIDGPPGIGCPVISACAGADLGLIVTEPGLAGLHDLKRIISTLQHFHVPTVICINKADLSAEGTNDIRTFANDQGIEVLGEIPFDERVPQAMLQRTPITEIFPESPAAQSIQRIWKKTYRLLFPLEEE